jgi:hypothetical protein
MKIPKLLIVCAAIVTGCAGFWALTSDSSAPPVVSSSSSAPAEPSLPAEASVDVSKIPAAEITADDIAGSGNEIANAKSEKTEVDVAAVTAAYVQASAALDVALANVEGNPKFEEHKRQLRLVGEIVAEYKTARKQGADALALRAIAQRFADNADAIYFGWGSSEFNELRPADVHFQEAAWNVFRANRLTSLKQKISDARSERISAWEELSIHRARVNLNVRGPARDAIRQKKEAGETVDAAVEKRELLKATVVYLEDMAR